MKRISYSGLIHYWTQNVYFHERLRLHSFQVNAENDAKTFNINQLKSFFLFYIQAILFSLFILVIEVAWQLTSTVHRSI